MFIRILNDQRKNLFVFYALFILMFHFLFLFFHMCVFLQFSHCLRTFWRSHAQNTKILLLSQGCNETKIKITYKNIKLEMLLLCFVGSICLNLVWAYIVYTQYKLLYHVNALEILTIYKPNFNFKNNYRSISSVALLSCSHNMPHRNSHASAAKSKYTAHSNILFWVEIWKWLLIYRVLFSVCLRTNRSVHGLCYYYLRITRRVHISHKIQYHNWIWFARSLDCCFGRQTDCVIPLMPYGFGVNRYVPALVLIESIKWESEIVVSKPRHE